MENDSLTSFPPRRGRVASASCSSCLRAVFSCLCRMCCKTTTSCYPSCCCVVCSLGVLYACGWWWWRRNEPNERFDESTSATRTTATFAAAAAGRCATASTPPHTDSPCIRETRGIWLLMALTILTVVVRRYGLSSCKCICNRIGVFKRL